MRQRHRDSEAWLRKRIKNIRLIMRGLPDEAKHDIGYRTGWKLLTGRQWGDGRNSDNQAGDES